jgi:hypothetical protein
MRCRSTRRRTALRRIARFALLLAVLARAAPSAAQEPDPLARSNALFDEAKQLLAADRVAEACARFAESYRLAARGGTMLNLGLCHERVGKWLAARRELRDALAMARRDGRADREPVAAEHLAAVEAKLAWLVITPPPNVGRTSLVLRLDGAPTDESEWGAVPVEPGTHAIVVAAEGFRAREIKVDVPTPQRLSVRIDPLEPAHEVLYPATVPTSPPRTEARDHAARASSSPRALKTAALITGLVGIGVSLAAGAWALERKGVVSEHCDGDKRCDPTGDSAASTGRALVLVSTAAFAVGGVGLGAWLLLPSPAADRSTARAPSAGLVIHLEGLF